MPTFIQKELHPHSAPMVTHEEAHGAPYQPRGIARSIRRNSATANWKLPSRNGTQKDLEMSRNDVQLDNSWLLHLFVVSYCHLIKLDWSHPCCRIPFYLHMHLPVIIDSCPARSKMAQVVLDRKEADLLDIDLSKKSILRMDHHKVSHVFFKMTMYKSVQLHLCISGQKSI